MIFPFPHEIYESVSDITPRELERLGIEGLLLDIDGTLARTDTPRPDDNVMSWLRLMEKSGIKLYILSNNKSPERTKSYAGLIGCRWSHRSRKPSKKGFLEAAQSLGLPPERCAIVGDQIYTDVLGGLRCGMKTLMVQTLDSYLWYFPLRRLVELPFRYRRKNG